MLHSWIIKVAAKKGNPGFNDRRALTPLQRFVSFCRFEPETGCVVWTGGTTMGRGHHVPYPAFWFEGRRWFGHRWAAQHIHGFDIEHYHVDHCCPNIPIPNTLCVEHLTPLTPRENRELQHLRRKRAIHLQVGLLTYEDVYGHAPGPEPLTDEIPFYLPPEWFVAATEGLRHEAVDCPF